MAHLINYDFSMHNKQGVVLTGRNTTGPPWSVGRPTTRARGSRPAVLQMMTDGWWQQTTTDDDRRQLTNNTRALGGPVIKLADMLTERLIFITLWSHWY